MFHKYSGKNLRINAPIAGVDATGAFIRFLWAVRPPPQNAAKAKKLGGGSTAHKKSDWFN
ncbi:hypothetical protein GNE09_20175 [Bacillus cereus]|nr:hypothetical protein GNE09_20175 [Bacillus cereus]